MIAKYTFDNTIEDVIPTFNDEFEYDFIDVVEGNITTRCINGQNDKLYNISFRDSMGLLEVEYINTKGLESLNSMFRNCKKLEKIDLSRFNTDNVIDFNSMFYLCKNLSEVNMAGLEPEVVNKYIEWLPNRKSPLSGIIVLDDNTDINIAAANDKSWEITNSIIVKYVFDSNIEEDVNPNVDAANTAKLLFLNKKDNICTKALVLCGEEAVAPTLLDFANSKGLIEIKKIECEGLLQLTDMFFKCSNLTKVRFDSGGYTFSDATNMFYGCESLTELDFSKFETQYNVKTARNMFAGCTNLKNVTGLSQIFHSDLEDASYMFKDCVSLTSIDMNYIYIYYETMGMFEGCTNLVEIKNFNYMQDILIAVNMFKDCKSITDISFTCAFNEETVATDMFAGCDNLERVHLDKVDSFTANRIIDILPVVEENSHHVLVTGDNIIDEEAAAAKNWENRCYYLYNIVITESGNTPSVLFDTTSAHNQLVKYKKISDNVYESACYADLLPTRYEFRVLGTKLLSLSYIDTSNVTDMSFMFHSCSKLTSLDLSSFDTSKVTTMMYMFYECNNLTSLDLSSFDTSKVTNMSHMFTHCSLLTTLDVSNFDTSKVTSMESMFYNCNNLISVGDLSNWKDTKVTSCQYMFQACHKITSINLSNFICENLYNITQIFTKCYELESLKLTKFRWNGLSSSCFSGCDKLREIDVTDIYMTTTYTPLEHLINLLPSRTANSPGIIRTGNCNYTEANYTAANAKNWIIEPNADVTDLKRTIAIYAFNNNTDTLPKFNDGYDYLLTATTETINVVNDFIGPYTWENMMRQEFTLPISSKIKFSDITKITVVNTDDTRYIGELEKGDDIYYNLILSRTVLEVYEVDGVLTFRCAEEDSGAWMPDILEISIEYAKRSIGIVDVDNGDGTITRTITSNSLPSKVSFNGETGLVSLSYLNNSNVTSMSEMFYYCENLISIDLSNWNTSNVTDMSYMFYNCSNLTTLDVSSFDTSNVTNMSCMFNICSNLTSLDLSSFNTSKVTNMGYMFNNCTNLTSLDLSSFDTSNVTNMSFMFNNCSNLTSLDLSNFNTSNVTNMSYMFSGCSKLSLIRANNLSSSTINTFIGQLPTLSSPNYGILRIGKTDMTDVDTTTANDNLWFINGLKIAEYEFSTDFDPTFNEGFEYTAITNNNIKAIISNGIRPSDISFENKTGLVSLSYLDTSNVTDINNMFYHCYNLTSLDLSSFDTSNVTSMYDMFRSCYILTSLDLSSFDTSNVTSMANMFNGCNNLTTLDVSSFDTSNVTDMSYMFAYCNKLTSLDVSNFDTNNVTNMRCMINGCTNLTSLDVISFDTSNVTDMGYMFYNCNKLTSLDVSNFNTVKVTDMSDMFGGCSELKSLDIRNFDVNKVTDITNIFTDSNNIKIIRLDNSDMNTINTIISLLPERISIGKLYITNVNDVSGIDRTTAASKKWKIVVKENRMNTFVPINLGNKSIRAIYTNNESYL